MVTSGVRLGTPAGTTRGFGIAEFREVGHLIGEVLDGAGEGQRRGRQCGVEARGARAKVLRTLPPLPVYPG